MRIVEARVKANLFPVKNYKKRSSPFLSSKYVPSLQILYTVYLYGLFKIYVRVGSCVKGEETYLKIEKGDDLFFKVLTLDIMRQTASLVFNPIMVEGYAALFSCTAVVQASDSMTALM